MKQEKKKGCWICENMKDFHMPESIVESAKRGDLILFAGAGVSTEAKGLLPTTLYETIRHEIGEKNTNISFSKLMSKYCKTPNGKIKLIKQIKDRLNYINSFPELKRMACRFHRELSTIYSIKEIVTTNWDDYFEEVCGCTPHVTSEDFALSNSEERKVYKIHGSINNYGSIIATYEDYKKCYKNFHKNLIGSKLKLLLSSSEKVVVFIGYSLYDEDFNWLWKFLKRELGELLPHYYVVTLDDNIKDRLSGERIIPIITDATYFISKLKDILIKEDFMISDDIYLYAQKQLDFVKGVHDAISKVSLHTMPDLIYTLMYQDGLIHCYERAIALKKIGYYSNMENILLSIKGYKDLLYKYKEKEIYTDVAYIEGYLNGLISLRAYQDDIMPPLFYLFDYTDAIYTFNEYKEKREDFIDKYDKAWNFAKRFVSEHKENIVIHHKPYL